MAMSSFSEALLGCCLFSELSCDMFLLLSGWAELPHCPGVFQTRGRARDKPTILNITICYKTCHPTAQHKYTTKPTPKPPTQKGTKLPKTPKPTRQKPPNTNQKKPASRAFESQFGSQLQKGHG